MESIVQDFRYGIRALLKEPVFAAVAVLALALGIGSNTAIFSVVDNVLLHPLPYPDSDKLVWVWGSFNLGNRASVSPADFVDYRARCTTFEEFAAFRSSTYNLTGRGEPERLSGSLVSANFFRAFHVQPFIGRDFRFEGEQVSLPEVVVLSYGLWERRFGSDKNLAGKTISLDGHSVLVAGVMPKSFDFPSGSEFWTPMPLLNPGMQNRSRHFVRPIGRLKQGVSLAQAQAEIKLVAAQLEQQYPKTNTSWSLQLVPLQEQIVGGVRQSLLVLFGVVAFVLLIACANVANLLLARATVREKELSLRAAMGATRFRIIRQLLTESVLLSVIGGAAGMLIAVWSVALLVSLKPADLPRLQEIAVNYRAFGFALFVSIATGFAFGLVPAMQASRCDLSESLKAGDRGFSSGSRRSRVRSALVICEVALALVLLAGAGLMINSLHVVTRLKPDSSIEQARAEMVAIAARLDQAYPETNKNWSAQVVPLREFVTGDLTRSYTFLLLGAVAFVLLIACSNVANLSISLEPPAGRKRSRCGWRWARADGG